MTPSPSAARRLWLAAMPGLFVFLWSTGFISAKLGLPYAEPFTFLTLRFGIVAVLLLALSLAMRAPWPKAPREYVHIAVAGLLVHGVYLGGVFASIFHGVSAGVSALIVGIQPLLTALLAGPLLGERVTFRAWIGLVLGLIGVALVVSTKFGIGEGSIGGYLLSVAALVGMTAGTLYQKRFCAGMDIRSGGVLQFAATTVLVTALAFGLETREVVWSNEFVIALSWSVVIMSIGAITLLYALIRQGEAYRVSTLFYLVPPSTAVIAYFLFDETLSAAALIGMAIAAVGVALVNTSPAK